jgi:hypothetical protein
MLDYRLWGLNPNGFHLTSIALHSMTVFCLCLFFAELLPFIFRNQRRDTAPSVIRAAIAGALFFGLHPLRVESVAWASERKGVLCLLFFTLACWTHLRHNRRAMADPAQPCWRSAPYWGTLAMTALALMSKPAAVSLPLVLLLVDWYPLGRITDRPSLFRCTFEKIPHLLLTGLGIVLTLFAQQSAMGHLQDVSLASRLLVACRALIFYLGTTIWPAGLAALYAHPGNVTSIALAPYLGYAAVVIGISAAAILTVRRAPQWLALWLFYLITLLPMLGLIQVGIQWRADRYSYLPSLGLALLWGGGISWLAARLRSAGHHVAATICLLLAAGQLVALTGVTMRQIPFWHDTGTLATRIIRLMPEASTDPYYVRAEYRINLGEDALALEDINTALKVALRDRQTDIYPQIWSAKAQILANLGRYPEAKAAADQAVQISGGQLPAEFLQFRDELGRKLAHTAPAKAPAGR